MYSPVSLSVVVETVILLCTVLLLVVVVLIITRLSPTSRVPLWFHLISGAGNPSALQNKVAVLFRDTINVEGEELVMNGATANKDKSC